VDGDVGVVGARGDRKRMPLVVANIRTVEEQPLSWLVLHAGLGELDLNSVCLELGRVHARIKGKHTVRVADDLDNLGLAPAADLTVQAVGEVKTTTDKLPSPSLITDAVGPEADLVERRKGSCCVADEAACGVGVHAEQERDKKVVSVPESLERLLANAVMGGRVDQQHAKQHDVASDATCLSVVNMESKLRSHLGALDVEEAVAISQIQPWNLEHSLLDVMSAGMHNGEEKHRVGDLSMEPLRLIKRCPSSLGTEPAQDVPAHWHDNDHGVD
jgi:hypothetical protein